MAGRCHTPGRLCAQRGATVGTSVLTRAFDLRDAGLDVAIVVDSTGSMQIAIDTARDAIADRTFDAHAAQMLNAIGI